MNIELLYNHKCPRCNDIMKIGYHTSSEPLDFYGCYVYICNCRMRLHYKMRHSWFGQEERCNLYTMDIAPNITVQWCQHQECILNDMTAIDFKYPPNTLPFTITLDNIETLMLFQ